MKDRLEIIDIDHVSQAIARLQSEIDYLKQRIEALEENHD